MFNRRRFIQAGTISLLAPLSVYGNKRNKTGLLGNTLTEPVRKIKVEDEVDVIVCGGGPAGFAAAVAAARNGANVRLMELQGCLGGIWTSGLMTYFIDHENKGGIMRELLEVQEKDGVLHRNLDVELTKLWLEKFCIDAGVKILYHTRIVGTYSEKKKLRTIVTENGSGRQAWNAKVFIDCTGNGDLAARAGCNFDFGHPETGVTQPMSLCALLTGIDINDLKERNFLENLPHMGHAKANLLDEIRRGGADCSYGNPTLWAIKDGLYSLMSNHEYNVKSLDAKDITNATINARQEVYNQVEALKSLSGIWKDIRLVATANHIGMREGRRIHGRYLITLDDLKRGARFDDAVCRVTVAVNHHSLNAVKSLTGENYTFKTEPWDVPLRSLIAKDLDGLMMAGRCISGDFWALGSYRMTGSAVAMGEAAGIVAAKAVQTNIFPHQVDYKELTRS